MELFSHEVNLVCCRLLMRVEQLCYTRHGVKTP